jgi:hypothetical protein
LLLFKPKRGIDGEELRTFPRWMFLLRILSHVDVEDENDDEEVVLVEAAAAAALFADRVSITIMFTILYGDSLLMY